MNSRHYSGNPGLDAMLEEAQLCLPDLITALRTLAADASRCILDLYAIVGEVAVSKSQTPAPSLRLITHRID